jgi:hypothetical protein
LSAHGDTVDGREQWRARLARRLEQVLGREEAETLMAQLPPYDWPDLATKQDIAELRGDMEQLRGELKGDMKQLRGEMDSKMANHVRTHIIATVTAVAATGSLAFTAAGLM